MMHWLVYLYYLLMVLCFIASLFYLKSFKIRLLAILLFFSIAVEILAEIAGVAGTHHFFLYHFYNIIEYFFVSWILTACLPPARQALKKLILGSSAIYALLSLWISFSIEGLENFPSIGTNIESVALIVWCLVCFWKLEPADNIPIQQRSDFWIILAFFLYFAGTFCFNSLYNTLLASEKKMAQLLFSIINSIFNYILYICLIIGIRCLYREEKYSEQ